MNTDKHGFNGPRPIVIGVQVSDYLANPGSKEKPISTTHLIRVHQCPSVVELPEGGTPNRDAVRHYRAAASFGALLMIWLALRVASASPAGVPAPAEPFLPGQATVILLAGIPGDSESETAYQDQLQQWLELATAIHASKIFVMADSPETSNLPRKPNVVVLKGDRDHFLGLGKALAGTTNPLVVIAWGHGGRQGGTPVLHVRGPRLTPRDFADLADQAPAASSHWALFFRGSGAFASQLAGNRRQVLASDCETMFSNDPIGMQLLLKIVRGAPEATFAQVADSLGRATAGWYSERKLARTEEPMLWLPEQKPRFLASSETEGNMADAPAQPADEQTNHTTNDSRKKLSETEKDSLAELSPIWKQINKVKPEAFPEADAIILRQHLSCTLGKRPAIVTEQEQFVQVLTAEGKQYGDFDVSYAPPGEEIEFLDCEVLQPNGKMVRLDPETIAEAGEPAVGDYQMGRRKFFSLPGVTRGAVLHVRYRSQWNDFPLPHISLELPLSQELPALESSVEVSVPKETPFHFGFDQVSAPDPVIKQTSYSSIYSWQLANLPAQPHEVLTGPQRQARLLLSTFQDWNAFSQWYERITRLSAEVTPEIEAKANELTRDSHTAKEKVLALYNYVTGLRYVAIPLGINTVRPHAAANVLQNQFGDCKDKANLFNALLQTANIEAHLVLVPRFSQAYEGIPGLAFNHAISQVRLGDEVFWVDTTDEMCRFGLLPPGDPERKVLVIDGQTTSLTQLPAAAPSQHQLQIHGELSCGANAAALLTILHATATGYPDYELRTMAREAKDHRASLPLLSAKFRPVAGSFAVDRQSATAASALAEDFAWQAKGTWFGLCSSVEGKSDLHSPFWLPKEWDLALNSRQSPLFLNEGYPLTLDEDFDFSLPAKPAEVVLPPTRASEDEPLRWRVEWTRIGDDKLVARLHAQLGRGELSKNETGAVQQQLRSLLSALGVDANFTTR
jgi:uncharacterized protein DUF3857/transglutaminase superfamily protein